MTKNDKKKRRQQDVASLQFSRVNAILGAAALATITVGYYLLASGSINAAPVLLVVGYAVLIPLAIIL